MALKSIIKNYASIHEEPVNYYYSSYFYVSIEAKPSRVVPKTSVKKYASTRKEPVNYDYSYYFSYFSHYSYVAYECHDDYHHCHRHRDLEAEPARVILKSQYQ